MSKDRGNTVFIKRILNKYFYLDFISLNLAKISSGFFILTNLVLLMVLLELSYNFPQTARTMVFYTLLFTIMVFIIFSLSVCAGYLFKNYRNRRRVISKIDSQFVNLNLLMIYDLLEMKNNSEIKDKAVNDLIQGFRNEMSTPEFLSYRVMKIIYYKIIFSMAVIIFLFTNVSADFAIERIINYDRDFSIPASHSLTIINPNIFIAERDTVALSCFSTGEHPDIITFYKRNLNSDTYVSKELSKSGDSLFTKKIVESNSFYYYFQSSEVSSDTGSVTILKRPDISDMKIIVSSPQYTKIPVREYSEIMSKLSVYKGSLVSFHLTPSISDPDSIMIKFNDNSKTFLNKDENGIYNAEFSVKNDIEFRFEIYKSSNGIMLKNINPIIHRIEVINDEYPIVNLIYPEDGYLLDESMQIPVFATATDDFEISSTRIYFRKLSFNEFSGKMKQSDYIANKVTHSKDKEGISVINTYVSCRELNLLPEDKVEIFLRAYDNDTVSGPKYTDSKIKTIMLPSLEQLLTSSEKSYDSQDKILKEELERNSTTLEKLSEMTEKLKKNQDFNWDDQKKMKQIIDDQEKINKSMNDLKQEIKKNISMMDENSLLSEETMNKYMKLQKLVDELFTSDMKDKLKKLTELPEMNQFDKKEYSELLKDFEKQQQEFNEGIEKSIEILEQIKQEYMLDRLLRQIDDMITKQNEVNTALSEKDIVKNDQLSKEKKIESSFDYFKNELKNFNIESKSSEIRDVYDNLEKKDLKNDFSDIQKQIGSSDQNTAKKTGSEISSKLLDTKEGLSALKKDMLDKQKEELKKDINDAISDLLLISNDIEYLKNFSRDISSGSSHSSEIIKKFSRTNSSFQTVSDKIFKISKKTFFIDKSIIAQIGRLNELFSNISSIFSNRYFSFSYERNNFLMGGVNNLVVQLTEAKKELDKSDSPSGLEEMLKKMEELAKKQSELNSQSSSMQSGQNQMSMSQMQEMMNRLAMEQAQLYDALMKMQSNMSQPGKDGNPGQEGSPGQDGSNGQEGMQPGGSSGQGLGGQDGQAGNSGAPKNSGKGGSESGNSSNSGLGKRLGNIGDAMKEIEKQLKDKKLDESLISKQNQVLDKLLDAIESVKREKYENKRESRSGNNQAVDPGKLDIKFDQNLQEMLIRSLKDGYTNKYKIKIKNYFRELEN